MSSLDSRRSGVAVAVVIIALILTAGVPAAAGEEALTDLQGGRLQPGEFGRGAVIAVFMATWSPRCRDVVSRAEKIQRRWGDRARVVLVSFQEDAATVREFVGETEIPVYLDPEAAYSKQHSITFLPGLLVLTDGAVAFRGRLGSDPDGVLAQILG